MPKVWEFPEVSEVSDVKIKPWPSKGKFLTQLFCSYENIAYKGLHTNKLHLVIQLMNPILLKVLNFLKVGLFQETPSSYDYLSGKRPLWRTWEMFMRGALVWRAGTSVISSTAACWPQEASYPSQVLSPFDHWLPLLSLDKPQRNHTLSHLEPCAHCFHHWRHPPLSHWPTPLHGFSLSPESPP